MCRFVPRSLSVMTLNTSEILAGLDELVFESVVLLDDLVTETVHEVVIHGFVGMLLLLLL